MEREKTTHGMQKERKGGRARRSKERCTEQPVSIDRRSNFNPASPCTANCPSLSDA